MLQKIIHFIKYNNAFTIIFVICFFGFGISFAASPQLRDSVYSSNETIVSINNSLIVSTDLDNFSFNLRISSVTEDEKNYYAVYSYQTLVIENGFWQNKEIEKTMTVNKEALAGKDLGLYVAEELGENINSELAYLKRVQKLEKEKGESQKVVAVAYSGLIGKLLNSKEEVIEGYNPVIPEPVPEVPATVESNPAAVIVSTLPTPTESGVPDASIGTGGTPTSSEASVGASPLPVEEATPPPLPAPEEMIDEELVQDVVEELLQEQETSNSTESPQPAPEPAPETVSEPPQ